RGTKLSPVQTLDKAIEIATNKGVTNIYMQSGIWMYTTFTTISIPKGLTIKGGFDSSFSSQTGYSTLSNASIEIDKVDRVTISRLWVKGNTSRGIYISSSKDITIANSGVSDINSSFSYGGGVLVSYSTNIEIKDTVIHSCKVKDYGGGMEVFRSYEVYVIGCTITNCIADSDKSGTGGGGAISVESSGKLYVMNNVMLNCGIPSNSPANDSVIIFYSSFSTQVRIEGNTIGGVSLLSTYGVYEEVSISGHVVKNNTFKNVWYPYYDYVRGSLSINELNGGLAGTSEASGNVLE
ncbi:MAG: right-handed parallel beta-helix repeat-containing protein, partial [Brevinematia bacterium]